MECKQPHYCVCRGEWPCVFDKLINHTTMIQKELLPSELLFLFGAELTSLKEPITLSSKHNAAPMAEMVVAFCKKYNLEEPRENWHKLKPS